MRHLKNGAAMKIFLERVLIVLICVSLVFAISESKVFVSAAEESDETVNVSQNFEVTVEEEAAAASDKVTKGFSRSWIPVVVLGAALVALIYTKREKGP